MKHLAPLILTLACSGAPFSSRLEASTGDAGPRLQSADSGTRGGPEAGGAPGGGSGPASDAARAGAPPELGSGGRGGAGGNDPPRVNGDSGGVVPAPADAAASGGSNGDDSGPGTLEGDSGPELCPVCRGLPCCAPHRCDPFLACIF